MKKYIVGLWLSIFICLDIFLVCRAIFSFKNIETFEKKIAWVESKYKHRKRKGYTTTLVVYLSSKPIETNNLIENINDTIEVKVNRYSFRKLPKVRRFDKVSYYIMKDPLFNKEKAIGLSSDRQPQSSFQLFLDILDYYTTTMFYYTPIIVIILRYLLNKIFFKREENKYEYLLGIPLIYRGILLFFL